MITQHKFRLGLIAVITASVLSAQARADEAPMIPEDLQRQLEDLEDHAQGLAEDFGAEARDAVQELLQLVNPMIDSLSLFIDGLPAYHAPEILPNGDIIIRRKPANDNDLKTPSGPEEEFDT